MTDFHQTIVPNRCLPKIPYSDTKYFYPAELYLSDKQIKAFIKKVQSKALDLEIKITSRGVDIGNGIQLRTAVAMNKNTIYYADGSWNGFQKVHIFGDTLVFADKENYFGKQ